jgi:hypothetical protein
MSDKEQADAFLPIPLADRSPRSRTSTCHFYSSASFYDRFEEEDDDDDDPDDDVIDPDSLGDWRAFRRNLAMSMNSDDGEHEVGSTVSVRTSVSKENEEVLSSQNEALAEEFIQGVWAHTVSTVSCFRTRACFVTKRA